MQQREALLAAGQHLKRGVLLYGPPGTGKTHLVRHLLSRTPGTTAVLLSGRTLGLLNQATALARAAPPAIVVLEDCDLVAEHRGGDTNAALFETLEAMDGLAPDADVAFILTTNRVDLLERALVERPGRVDLAVEITKPDLEARERLFRLYAAEMLAAGQLTEAAVHTAAARTEGVTASFTKELIRRVAINAAQEERPPRDADVSHALDEMLSDAESLTRTLLGGEGSSPEAEQDEGWGPAVGPGIAPSGSWPSPPPSRTPVTDDMRLCRARKHVVCDRFQRDARGGQPNQRRSSKTGPPSAKGTLTSSAASWTSAGASPMATPRPAQRSISMSLRPSPKASTSAAGTPSPRATSARAVALFTPSGAMSSQALQPTK